MTKLDKTKEIKTLYSHGFSVDHIVFAVGKTRKLVVDTLKRFHVYKPMKRGQGMKRHYPNGKTK